MNEIIVALLFLYPGGLIDIFLNANKSATYSTHEMDNISRTALCFAYSVVSTFIAILVFGGIMLRRVDLAATLALLNTWSGLLVYALISLIAIAPATGIIWSLHSASQKAYTKYMSWKGKGVHSPIRTVWRDICNNDMKYVVRIINSRHETVTQGYLKVFPEDIHKDKGIALAYPDKAGEVFNDTKMKKFYLEQPEFVYFDSNAGYLYEFYDADRYLHPEKYSAKEKCITPGEGAAV